jgi:hypothetical protein
MDNSPVIEAFLSSKRVFFRFKHLQIKIIDKNYN